MLTTENIATASAAEILDAYADSDYPADWTITSEHFGGTGAGTGNCANLGVRLLVCDGAGEILRCIEGSVSGELAQALGEC